MRDTLSPLKYNVREQGEHFPMSIFLLTPLPIRRRMCLVIGTPQVPNKTRCLSVELRRGLTKIIEGGDVEKSESTYHSVRLTRDSEFKERKHEKNILSRRDTLRSRRK